MDVPAMNDAISKLHEAIEAVCPIVGVSIGREPDSRLGALICAERDEGRARSRPTGCRSFRRLGRAVIAR